MTAYDRAPILEAVIDLQFEADPLSMRDMERIITRIQKRYPNSQLMSDYNFDVRVQPSGTAKAHANVVQQWFKCAGNDASEICNIRPLSMTTARLAPYAGWEALFQKATENFDDLIKVVGGFKRISRYATRFINRIDVPSPGGKVVDPRSYLQFLPISPVADYESAAAFTSTLQYQHKDSGATVVLNSALLEPVLLNGTSFLLDIDVFVDKDVPLRVEDVFLAVDKLRQVKNDIFERLITDETRALLR